MAEPKYWGTVKGRILHAIVSEFCDLEETIHVHTSLRLEVIRQAIVELQKTGELSYTDEGLLWVDYPLYKSYESFGMDLFSEEMRGKMPLDTEELDTIEWIYQWKEKNDDTITLHNKHFFLEGELLTEFTNGLLNFSRENVIVVNPFVDVCSTTRILRARARALILNGVKTHSVTTQIVTRSPEADSRDYSRKRKIAWHKELADNGVDIYYNDLVHAKIILIDDVVAINSSMNLIGTSVGSQSWESGIITFDENVIKSIRNSVFSLMSSNLTTRAHKR